MGFQRRTTRFLVSTALVATTIGISAPAATAGGACFGAPSHVTATAVTLWMPPCGGRRLLSLYFVIPPRDEQLNQWGQPWREGDQPYGYAAAVACNDGEVYSVALNAWSGTDVHGNKIMTSMNQPSAAWDGGTFSDEPDNMRCVFSMGLPWGRVIKLSLGYDWTPGTDPATDPSMGLDIVGAVA